MQAYISQSTVNVVPSMLLRQFLCLSFGGIDMKEDIRWVLGAMIALGGTFTAVYMGNE